MKATSTLLGLAVLGSVCLPALSLGQSLLTDQMGISQQLGTRIPADTPFVDETGRSVTIDSYLHQRPVLLLLIFYKCQTGCPMITDGLVQTLLMASHPRGMMGMLHPASKGHPLTLGKDLEVVMIGIDPRETPELAANKKAILIDSMKDDPAIGDHWHLLTGSQENIRKLTDAIGFKYYFNAQTGVIRHPTCSVILTPDGTISAYTIGNDFPTKLLEDDLALAAKNQVAAKPADQGFMFGCVMLDPATGKIRFVVENILRVAGVLTLLILGGSIYLMIRSERKNGIQGGGQLTGV